MRLGPVRFLSAFVLIAVVNVFVFANGAVVSRSSSATLGKLITTSNRPVVVNGAEAITGTVILSGTQLVTPAASLASVQIGKLGTVMIAPSSSVVLNFDNESVAVKIYSGDATVTTAEGVKATVSDAAGNPRTVNPAAPAGGSAKNWGIAGVVIGGGAFIWAIVAWNKANDADDAAKAAQASAATLASQLAALRTCLANQTSVNLCRSF